MSLFRQIINDIKTYIKIHSIYPKWYKNSIIESYIVDESILGSEIIIKKNVSISSDCKKIGNCTYIGDGTQILNCSQIGNFTSISHDVKIGLENHQLNCLGTSPIFYSKSRGWIEKNTFEREQPTVIENDVLISANAMIMSGITIGNGAVIGAGAFVNKDVPPYAIVAGTPAKIIRYRFDEKTIDKLQKSQWWNKNKQELLEFKEQFTNIEPF